MKAPEVGYLGGEVLDPPRLDPQLFQGAEAGRDSWVRQVPSRFVAPIRVRLGGEDNRREGRIVYLSGRDLQAVIPKVPCQPASPLASGREALSQ